MAEKAVRLEEAISLALSLSSMERLKLVERVVLSVEHELEAPTFGEQEPEGHWGRRSIACSMKSGQLNYLTRKLKTLWNGSNRSAKKRTEATVRRLG
jgi:hypothetical protein